MPSLKTLGWNERYGAEFALHSREGLVPGRVTAENRTNRLVAYEGGELIAELSGRLLHEAQSPSDLPKVGDWVALEIRDQGARGTIRAVLDRLTRFSRKFSGESTASRSSRQRGHPFHRAGAGPGFQSPAARTLSGHGVRQRRVARRGAQQGRPQARLGGRRRGSGGSRARRPGDRRERPYRTGA